MILGLDMSSKKSGYSLFDGENLIDYGCWEISFDEEQDWRERIRYMADRFNNYCRHNKIEYIYIEDVPPILDNSNTVKVLSALQGAVLSIAHLRKIPIKFIPNNRWKNDIGIEITHSKEFIKYKKQCKVDNKNLSIFKSNVKAYEKKMSVDYVNSLFNICLKYISKSSKNNQDDISDSICLIVSQTFKNVNRYNLDTIENIILELYNSTPENKK